MQDRWIAYNKMRGQYSSAMEHAVPEQFWVDRSSCRYTEENGQIKNPTLQDCAQGISAVKAIAIAQQQGQKIYTINRDNAATALPKLPVGGEVGAEIRSAVNAGKEVTVHERAINAHGWSGYGYIIVDPETGAGAYLIEGKGNGGIIMLGAAVAAALSILLMMGANPAFLIVGVLLFYASFATFMSGLAVYMGDVEGCKFLSNMGVGLVLAAIAAISNAAAWVLGVSMTSAIVLATNEFQNQIIAKCK